MLTCAHAHTHAHTHTHTRTHTHTHIHIHTSLATQAGTGLQSLLLLFADWCCRLRTQASPDRGWASPKPVQRLWSCLLHTLHALSCLLLLPNLFKLTKMLFFFFCSRERKHTCLLSKAKGKPCFLTVLVSLWKCILNKIEWFLSSWWIQ